MSKEDTRVIICYIFFETIASKMECSLDKCHPMSIQLSNFPSRTSPFVRSPLRHAGICVAYTTYQCRITRIRTSNESQLVKRILYTCRIFTRVIPSRRIYIYVYAYVYSCISSYDLIVFKLCLWYIMRWYGTWCMCMHVQWFNDDIALIGPSLDRLSFLSFSLIRLQYFFHIYLTNHSSFSPPSPLSLSLSRSLYTTLCTTLISLNSIRIHSIIL